MLMAVVLLSNCASKKEVVYFQDIDHTTLELADSIFKFPTLQVNDVLQVQISALDQESVTPFRLNPFQQQQGNNQGDIYVVQADGTIHMPILGKIHAAGLTVDQLRNDLTDSISTYLINPVISVRINNTKFTILGAVNSPGTFSPEEETITLLQAIGMAGDFRIDGKRTNVLLIRQINGERSVHRIDFTSSTWLNSEFYYIRQNDVLYVEPNYATVKTAGIVKTYGEMISLITTITTYIILLTRT